jgi:hypothetical protein
MDGERFIEAAPQSSVADHQINQGNGHTTERFASLEFGCELSIVVSSADRIFTTTLEFT